MQHHWCYIAVHSHQQQDQIIPPSNIIGEYVDEAIETYRMQFLISSCKRGKDEESTVPTKRQMVKYNRRSANKCVYEDWMATSPRPLFDDKQFECIFCLKRCMVDYFVGHFANNNSFWTSTIDSCGRESIDPYVKFLSAQKMICYSVSWSAFHDYFHTTLPPSSARRPRSSIPPSSSRHG